MKKAESLAPCCDSCRFFAKNYRRAENGCWYGECRRRAPVVDDQLMTIHRFPETTTGDWCGKHEMRNGPPRPRR